MNLHAAEKNRVHGRPREQISSVFLWPRRRAAVRPAASDRRTETQGLAADLLSSSFTARSRGGAASSETVLVESAHS